MENSKGGKDMARYYGIWNHYGNNVIGAESLHVFQRKADRDMWNRDDPENKKRGICASHPLAREYRKPIEQSHGLTYTMHYYDLQIYVVTRDNGREYAELIYPNYKI
jgi:hypothetical protein